MEARMTERMIFNTFYNFYDFVSGKVSRRRPRAQVGRASDRRLMPEFSRTLLPIAHALVTLALGTCGFTTSSAQSHGLRIQEAGSTSLLANDRLVADHVLEIDWSPDLIRWEPYATVHRRLAPYPAKLESGPGRGAFFRLRTRSVNASDDWTNQLDLDGPDLFSEALPGLPAFAKFTIDLHDPAGRIYFQDSRIHPFHYPFIVTRLPGHEQMTLQEFERRALRPAEQSLVVGSVLPAPDPSLDEAAIQFAGNEEFPVTRVADWFQLIQTRLTSSAGTAYRLFYLPSFEQRQAAFENEAFFAEKGIRVATAARWQTKHACYAAGWAFGRLVFIPGAEIHQAFGDGRLTAHDILLTDTVPAEIPGVAGLLALTPATPNSHVAILARSRRIPFAFVPGQALQEQLDSLVGREILLVVEQSSTQCTIATTDTSGRISDEHRQAILDLKKPPAPTIEPKRSVGAFSLTVDALTPAAIDQVGGKAANFGVLRRAIPDASPSPALALTFDLWDAFLDQAFIDDEAPPPHRATLREAITDRLAKFSYPPDLSRLRPALREIQVWIADQSTFTETQIVRVLEALQVFDPRRKLRFRSSTNVEDSAAFSGAGLYDSFSGCAADDTDGDDRGPSRCDADQSKERGVFRAIRKVYASFYNENAYLERLRHGIDESEVGMAVLVHHSFPDPEELANGVATVEIRSREDGSREVTTELVAQPGAESVTNPGGGQQPEWVILDPTLRVLQYSRLTEETPVLTWPDEYLALNALLDTAARVYEADRAASDPGDGSDVPLLLDFEYKKMKSRGLVVKQIRTIPQWPHVPPPSLPF